MNLKELELEAMDILKYKWSHLYIFGYPKKPFPTNYENDLSNVILGLTSKYIEREKLKFANKQLEILLEIEEKNKTAFDKIFVLNLKKKLEEKLSKL